MINKFIEFITEINKSKINLFKDTSISNTLTTSIEIELESNRLGDSDSEYDPDQVSEIIDIINKSLIKEINRSNWVKLDNPTLKFIEDILHEIEQDYDDDDYILDNILSEKQYKKDKVRLFIIQILRPMVINYFFKENFSFLKSKFKTSFPKFYKKWSSELKFELDNTLDRGIEISNSSFFIGIEKIIDLINDFYDEYEVNKKWKFKKTTGIHINIGSIEKSTFNPLKGILFLDDLGEDPFVFKNMNWRKNNKYCGSIREELKKDNSTISKAFNLLKLGKITECELLLNSKMKDILIKSGYKNFGLNLLNLDKNYIEFRYPGGDISREVLIDKLLYFSYVYYMMVNPTLDKKEYQKKLYKFLSIKNPIA